MDYFDWNLELIKDDIDFNCSYDCKADWVQREEWE
jgi:hypothetical protein